VKSDDGRVKKIYDYSLLTADYVGWDVKSVKANGDKTLHTSLIFIGGKFLSAVEISERRNLIYDFKSLLRRDPKGRVVAGLYFSIAKVCSVLRHTSFCFILHACIEWFIFPEKEKWRDNTILLGKQQSCGFEIKYGEGIFANI